MGKLYRRFNTFMKRMDQQRADLLVIDLSTAGALVLSWLSVSWAVRTAAPHMQGVGGPWFLIFGGIILFIPVVAVLIISWGLGITALVMTIKDFSHSHNMAVMVCQGLTFLLLISSAFLMFACLWILWLVAGAYVSCALILVFKPDRKHDLN